MASEARRLARGAAGRRRRARSRPRGIAGAAARGAPPLDRARRAMRRATSLVSTRTQPVVAERGRGLRCGRPTPRRGRAAGPRDRLDRVPPPDAPERPPRAHPASRDRGPGRAGAGPRPAAAGSADVGTGTGCIALSLATEGGYAEVVGDRPARRTALALASENRRATGRARSRSCGAISARPLGAASRSTRWSPIPPILRPAEYAGPRSVGAGLGAGAWRW